MLPGFFAAVNSDFFWGNMATTVSMLSLILCEAEALLPDECRDLANGILHDEADTARLLIFADWFHEKDEPIIEYALRWMAKHNRFPQKWDSATKATGDYPHRDWQNVFEWSSFGRNDAPSRLPQFLGGAIESAIAKAQGKS